MKTVRRAQDRGHANHGWLDTNHTFSFGSYYNKAQMGFRVLRVINEDQVEANNGFPKHPHDNMEILSFVLEGELEHRDSMGTGSVIRPGEFQLMSAGTGVTHSEFNPSKEHKTHFYQIWILPREQDLAPSYQQKTFPPEEVTSSLRLVVSPDGDHDSLRINQDTKVYWGKFGEGEDVVLPLTKERYGWLQIIKGSFSLGEETLNTSDGVAISEEDALTLVSQDEDGEILFFDLP